MFPHAGTGAIKRQNTADNSVSAVIGALAAGSFKPQRALGSNGVVAKLFLIFRTLSD